MNKVIGEEFKLQNKQFPLLFLHQKVSQQSCFSSKNIFLFSPQSCCWENSTKWEVAKLNGELQKLGGNWSIFLFAESEVFF